MDTYPRALAALSDPTRRKVFERLRSGPRPVGELARGLAVTRPAVSQHLKVLKGAHLVRARAEGTRRVYEMDPRGLAELRAYVDSFWDNALERYAGAVEQRSGERGGGGEG